MVVNTAVDAAVFLLLVSAAVAGVTAVDTDAGASTADTDRADDAATVLATSTATVNYSTAPGARRAAVDGAEFDRTDGPAFERTTHGSLADLLARAAVGTAGFDGRPVTHARVDLRRAASEAVAARLAPVGVRIDAVWRPYPDAPVEGRVAVGPSPPASAAVDAATLAVPTGGEPLSANETRSFNALSTAVAERTVETLAPARRTRLALRDDTPVSTLVRYRYARLAAEQDVSLDEPLGDDDTRAANRRLSDALAPEVESDLRGRYDAPADAAAAVAVSEVRIVVRTWPAGQSAERSTSPSDDDATAASDGDAATSEGGGR